MSREVRKELKIIPAKVSVVEYVSYVYACRSCEKNNTETTVITAGAPKALVPKSLVSPNVMAYIMNQKFVNAMPLYRQEQELKRMGALLSRQTLANLRRKFDEALTVLREKKNSPEAKGYDFCNALFEIERRAEKMSPEERHALRQKESKPLAAQFFEWAVQQSDKTLPKSLLGTALQYALNQKKYLCSFLEDGRIELSNNRAERSIKPFVIGRKNWLFCNTPAGAKSSAVLYSIIETAKENGLIPYAYLTYVFEQIRLHGSQSTENLLPWSRDIPDYCRINSKTEI